MYSAVSFVVLRDEPAERREVLCRAFYDQIYRDAFPNPDETEGPDTWLPMMGKRTPTGQPEVHVILAEDSKKVILGGIIFEFYRQSGSWLVTYIAVRREFRHHGIGAALIKGVVDTIARRTAVVTFFAEAKIPTRISTPSERDCAWTRLAILGALGMRRLPIDYVQPALSPEKHPIDTLYLLLYAGARGESRISSAQLIAFLTEFYAALRQSRSPHLITMCESLSRQPLLETTPLPPCGQTRQLRSSNDADII
jgi:GNAT superfamily N-acetyltransferase